MLDHASVVQIIAQAGLPGTVTIATNMAGRGTDIILGGSPEGLTHHALLRLIFRRVMQASGGGMDGGGPHGMHILVAVLCLVV